MTPSTQPTETRAQTTNGSFQTDGAVGDLLEADPAHVQPCPGMCPR